MNEDIIPITYMSGTGGNFLCHLIVSAKRNNRQINLSNYGNVHEFGLKDIVAPSFGMPGNDILKINIILKRKRCFGHSKPYYTVGHISDIEVLSSYFEKFIRITYELGDASEIATVLLGKQGVDADNVKTSKLHLEFYSIRFVSILRRYQQFFTQRDNYSSSLFISWKEIYHLDPMILINKLHNFTNIPIENFSIDMVNTWRIATKNGIDNIQKILNGQESM
jgi:hypothetical protein